MHCNDHGKGKEKRQQETARETENGNGNCRGNRQVNGVKGKKSYNGELVEFQ